ncbi:MAG: hypothetical protein AW07_02920 [Candidatus Accumulibacter sp. SK-11]|nr:MAG: hypothetical protein AW07_02920 [Candidatus Accumulibacter sp. SK-11]
MLDVLLGPCVARCALGEDGPYRLEERHVVADAQRLGVRHRQREGLQQLTHRADAPFLAVLLRQDVLLRERQQAQPLLRRAGRPVRPVETVEEAAADLVLLQHHGDRFVLVQRRAPGATALGVRRQRLLQLLREAQVVHHQPAGLVPEHAVDTCDRLHQTVPTHWLVDVHGMQARRVEAGEPHVAHEDELERVLRVAEAIGQRLAPRLAADVRLPVRRVGGRPGHHHLERAAVVVGAVPPWPQLDDLAIQLDADASAHADDHRLALQHLEPFLEMFDDVSGQQLQPPLGADHGLELRPLGLEPFLALDLLAFGRLLEARVDLRPLGLVERQPGQTALVVDRHRGAVLHGALDVVDADVVAEHRARVGVGQLDRRAGEADE